MKIKAGKYYKTRDGQKAYCIAVDLELPEGFGITSDHPCKLAVYKSGIVTTTIEGNQFNEEAKSDLDIVSEWVEQKQTRVFKSKKQLAKALLKGQKWRPQVKHANTCLYIEESYDTPFRINAISHMQDSWNYADGKTVWEKVE